MAEVKYIAKYDFPGHRVKAGEEVSPLKLGLSPTQFNYYIDQGSIEVTDGEHKTPVYDVHHL